MSFRIVDRAIVTAVRLAAIVGALLVLCVTFAMFYEVVARYVFNSPTTWSMDTSIYMLMWAVFLGAGYTLHTQGHVCVDVLVAKVPRPVRLLLRALTYLLVGAFSGVLAWRGLMACVQAYRFGEVTVSFLRTPLYVPLSAIPVGCSLLAAESLREFANLMLGDRIAGR